MSLSLSLPAAISSATTISHDARIALPPTHGANLNAAVMVAFVSGASACTCTKTQPPAGRLDPGPVHKATTTTSTAKGIQANATSLPVSPCSAACAATTDASIGFHPRPRAGAAPHDFSNSSNAQKHTMEPVTSGKYGPKKYAVGHCPRM